MTDKKDSEVIKLRGKVKWAKVFPENYDKSGPNGVWEADGGRSTITIEATKENLKVLKDSGSQRTAKEDSDGDMMVEIQRKMEAPYTYGGPPRVVHEDGKTPWTIDPDGLIGNGSECIVYATVYDAKGFRGTRLDVVQVVDHVEYESEYNPLKKYDIEDLSSGDKPAADKAKKNAKELDDEIPF